jgi:twitching motility protein PilT
MDMNELFDMVAQERASDLLISAGAPPILRIDGELFRVRADTFTAEATRELVYAMLTPEQRQQFEQRKELDFSLATGGKTRFRVNVYYQKGAVTAALRPIPSKIPTLLELGLPETVSELASARQGLVLVTGPTGSGKTTTLAALVDLINNKRACHIISVEDPIEYVHEHRRSIVDQREIGEDTDSFPSALKYVLRQDPDVIMIGEMRDLETIQAALTAAETGHLVFATLHTNDAVQTIDRVVDVFPAAQQQQVRFQLSMVLLAIVSQRLVPRRNGGRALACEIMIRNGAIANLIREQKSHQVYSVMETATREGMVTMDRSIKELYTGGLITREEAVSLMRNPKELLRAGE